MELQPAPPHEACYTARVHRQELQFVRDYPDLALAARNRIGDPTDLRFVAATISNATGHRFVDATIERESSDRALWVKAWRTDDGPVMSWFTVNWNFDWWALASDEGLPVGRVGDHLFGP
jgi:hypothetical protein